MHSSTHAAGLLGDAITCWCWITVLVVCMMPAASHTLLMVSHARCLLSCPAEDLDLTKEVPSLVLTEGPILGGGAFSRVSEVTEETTGNTYAMKRMRKQAVVQCPEHVYFEQVRQPGLLTMLVL